MKKVSSMKSQRTRGGSKAYLVKRKRNGKIRLFYIDPENPRLKATQ